MNLTADALSTVAQVLLGAVLAAGLQWFRARIKVRRPAARLWPVDRSRPVHIITAQDEADFVTEFTVKVYPAEYLAAVEVRALLCETLGLSNVHLWTSNAFPAREQLKDNLVCVGGPVHNKATAIVLERLNIPLRFDGYTLISDETGQRYDTVTDGDGRIRKDYGVLVLAPNPFRKKSLLTLMMGTRTFGCPAVSRILTSGDLSKTEDRLGAGAVRWAILEADVVEDFVARVRFVESSGARD